MNWDLKNRLPEALVGGATGLVVVGTFIVIRACIDGADTGDWLNFAGVIFGVLLTAGVTLALQRHSEWNRVKPLRQRLHFLVETLEYSFEQMLINHDLNAVEADIRAIGRANDELRTSDFEFVRSIHAQIAAFSSYFAKAKARSPSGKVIFGAPPPDDESIIAMREAIKAMKRITR